MPGTSAEQHFVSQTFASDNNFYHMGILSYSKPSGFYGVDNSHHVGSPYFTLDNNINTKEGSKIVVSDASCLTFKNQNGGVWRAPDPCNLGVGVCKSNLGK